MENTLTDTGLRGRKGWWAVLMAFSVLGSYTGYIVGLVLVSARSIYYTIPGIPGFTVIVIAVLAVVYLVSRKTPCSWQCYLKRGVEEAVLVNLLLLIGAITFIVVALLSFLLVPQIRWGCKLKLGDDTVGRLVLAFSLSGFLINLHVFLKHTSLSYRAQLERIPGILRHSGSKHVKEGLKFTSFLLLIALILLYVVVSFGYPWFVARVRAAPAARCSDSEPVIDCLWRFVLAYRNVHAGTYKMPCPKPQQLLVRINPLVYNRVFVSRLAALARTGACLDFALGITRLIEDIYSYRTRVVVFIGVDHAIPEVEVNGTWYVIDAVYTTPNHPVKIEEYGAYLKNYYPGVYRDLRTLRDLDTGQDLRYEHGLSKAQNHKRILPLIRLDSSLELPK